jgi:response regulator RpfG family c-di-GMP phosphodiesterase
MLSLRENITLAELPSLTRWAGKILVVNSQPQALDSLKYLLEENNYRVQTAQTGKATLQIAHQYAPDVILLDSALVDMTGFEVCQGLKAQPDTRSIPVLFLTTARRPEEIDQIFTAGGSDYILKPVREQELLARLQYHIFIQRLRNEFEAERREKLRLRQEIQNMVQSFDEQVKQRIQNLEDALAIERLARDQMINAARLASMSKTAAAFSQELNVPLQIIHNDLQQIKSQLEDHSGANEKLEDSLAQIERLKKSLVELKQIYNL